MILPRHPLLLMLRRASVATAMGVALAGCGEPAGVSSTPDAPAIDAAALENASLAEVLTEPDAFVRARRLADLLGGAGSELLSDVKPALFQARTRLGPTEFDLLVRYWALLEPERATRWALRDAPMLYKTTAIRTAVEIWAKRDPAATLAAVAGPARSADRDIAQSVQLALIFGWFQADREGAEAYVESLSGIMQQRSLMGYAIALARESGADAMMRWAESIPDEKESYKRTAFRQVTSALTWFDPDAAARWCAAHCEGPYGHGLRDMIVRARVSSGDEPAEVIAWAVETAPERLRPRVAHAAFAQWALRDRQEALRWMAEQVATGEPEPWLPALYGTYARYLASEDPAEAIRWAEQIPVEAKRELMLVRIVREWLQKDREAAEAWLSDSPLSEAARRSARNAEMPSYLPPPPAEDDPPAAAAEGEDGEVSEEP